MKWKWLLTAIFVLLMLGLAIQLRTMYDWWRKPSVNPYLTVYVEIKSGSSLRQVAHQLYKAGLINQKNYFVWQVRLRDASHHIKAGEYLFTPGMNPEQIYKQLKTGKVMQHAVTLVEGWTFNQFMADLAKQPLMKHDLQGLTEQQIMQKLGSQRANAEGMFYPDTYFYVRGTTETTILLKAYNTMQKHINQAWQQRSVNLPYQTSYEALIAASLIEKETASIAERPLVASVIINRLHKGMPLQIDPTVIYGLGPTFNGNITTKDLKLNTPYNTYLHTGLPPTPIAMPSASSIAAALHPADTNYLYFVAIGDGSGTHRFSDNLTQHDKAVKAYLKTLKNSEKPSVKSVPVKTSIKATSKTVSASNKTQTIE
jgi:UPF0755 protein